MQLLFLGFVFICERAFSAPVAPPPPALDPMLQLMISQPSIEITTNTEVGVSFDPPVAAPGQKSIYRLTFNALDDSIVIPSNLVVPPGVSIHQSARGQTFLSQAGKLMPRTAVNYHVKADEPGSYTIPEFTIRVYGIDVRVPAATLLVQTSAAPNSRSAAELVVETSHTNVYAGQTLTLQIRPDPASGSALQTLSGVRVVGDGFLADTALARQTLSSIVRNGRPVASYVYEVPVIALQVGNLPLSAQGFAIANSFAGTTLLPGQAMNPVASINYILLDSEPLAVHVRPLPASGRLPGFTGAIGSYSMDPPRVSTNRAQVGDLLRLAVTFRGDQSLARFVAPPPPRDPNWQIFSATRVGTPAGPGPHPPGPSLTFVYRMVPLANAKETPAIPFSYFDPAKASYVNLSIPPAPIQVTGGSEAAAELVQANVENVSAGETNRSLSALATGPGLGSSTLLPLETRPGFWLIQLAPIGVFTGLWWRDRRRRFLENHPEIVRRRAALRALRQERRRMSQALRSRDAGSFLESSIRALRAAAAPHFPAEPRALVCSEILEVLDSAPRTEDRREVVRKLFLAADASQFSSQRENGLDVLALEPELQCVLRRLEERL